MKLTTDKYMYVLTLADKSSVFFLRCCHLCVVGLTLDQIQYTQSSFEDRLGDNIQLVKTLSPQMKKVGDK